jgi:hypothetical protein
MYPGGGQLYTYSGRPGATYQKVNNQWYINTDKTNGQFIPVQDPTGKRTALLNAQAKPMAMPTNKYQRTYDPLLDVKPQVGETNQKVAQDFMMAKDSEQYAKKSMEAQARAQAEKSPEQIANEATTSSLKNSLTSEEKALAKEYFNSPDYNYYYDPERGVTEGNASEAQTFMERMDELVWPAFQPFTGNPSFEKTKSQEFEKNKVKKFQTLDDAMRAVYAERIANNRGQSQINLTPSEEVQRNQAMQQYQTPPGQMASGRAAPVDWLWAAPIAGPAALEMLGGLGAMSVPGMSAVPGATVGNLVNSAFIGNSLAHTPGNVKSWYDVSQGNKNWQEAAAESAEIAAGMIGSGAGAKAALQEAEKLGLKNVLTGKANVKDVFKRNDLINIKTPEELAAYEKAMQEGTLSATRNRFYSSIKDNSDFGKYAKGNEYVYMHRKPYTAAAAKGKSLANIKAEGAGLIAKQRSVPTLEEVEKLINSGKLSKYSEETLQGLKEVAAVPENYQNLEVFKNSPELQELIKNPKLVNPAEHLLDRPKVEDFELVHVDDIENFKSKLFNVGNVFAAAGAGLRTENALHNTIKHSGLESALEIEEKNTQHKLGETMNFKSNADYHKWLAYGHATGAFEKTPGNQPISVAGKSHNVQHALGGNMYASGGFANAGFMALPKEVQAKIRANTFADGGPMEAQLTEFTEGGRHEENPLGGIPQGTAPDGGLNLVEQGETKLNSSNYIFSDSLKVDKVTADQFALPKNEVGKTFAEISKKLNRPNSRRENDTIEQVAIKRDLDNLMNAQEQFKQKEVQKKMDEIRALDPNALAGLQQGAPQQMPQMDQMQGAPEMQQNVPQSVQPMGMPEGQPMDPNQIPPEMLAQMPEAQQGQPVMAMGGGMYKCGGKMYNFGGNMYDFGGFVKENNDAFTQAGTGALKSAGKGASIGATIGGMLAPMTFGLSVPAFAAIGAAAGGVGGAIKGGVEGHKQDEAEQQAKIDAANKERLTGVQTEIPQEASNNTAMALGQAALQGGQDMMGAFAKTPAAPAAPTSGGGVPVMDNAGNQMTGTGDAYSWNSGNMPTMPNNMVNAGMQNNPYQGFRAGGFAHNAGPMGQPLTNLYAEGGFMVDPGEPGGPGTPTNPTALAPVTVTRPKTSAPAIASYNPTLGSDYASQYAASLEGYRNNPKDPKTGAPMYGSGGSDAGSPTGTGGDYRPYTTAERAARIKMIEGLPATELRPDYLEEYQVLKNNKPYFVASQQPDKYIYEPYDLRKYTPPTAESLSTMYPPAPDPNALKQNYYTDANTGQVVKDYDPTTGQMVPRKIEGLTTGSIQYSQPLEQMANDPARLAAKAQQVEQRNENVDLLKNMTAEQKAAMRAAGQSPRQFLGLDQESNTNQKEMGGYLDSPTEDDMINHLTNLQQSGATHSFLRGGGFSLERDSLGNIVPYKVDYDALDNAASLDNPYNKGSLATRLALPDNNIDFANMTEEEQARILSDLEEADETLKDKNQDLTMNQTLAQGVGQLLPAAYNLGLGLFGKVDKLDPRSFYQKADFSPWEYNIDPQKKEVQRSYAQLSKAARDTGLGGGSYMSNMQQAAMSRNEAMSKLYAEKQNVDAANALDAKVRNKAIEASNKGILANVTDYNIKAREAKQQMAAAGLKQGADAARSAAEMAGQAAYMKLLAPDFAGTFKYNTIFDQALAKAEAKAAAAAKKKREKQDNQA